jgi:hypothetical protein
MNLFSRRKVAILTLAAICLVYLSIEQTSAAAKPQTTFRFSPYEPAHKYVPLGRDLWRWPVYPTIVESVFRQPNTPWGSGHRGIDLAVVPGTPLSAPTNAKVSFAGPVFTRPVVTLQTDKGLTLEFEPACLPEIPKPPVSEPLGLALEVVLPKVRVGQRVGAGSIFAVFCPVGAISHCAVACLHWGVRTDARGYLSPQRFVGQLRPSRPKAFGL